MEQMRYKLKLAYDGTAYHGWQSQNNAISIQATIEKAFYQITNQKIELVGCGRTDTGVHAKAYFAHFDTIGFNDEEIVYKLNSVLPPDIAIESCLKTDETFHARFSALLREYKYYIHSHKNPFLINKSYYLKKPLNIEQMDEACRILVRYSDFASFCKKGADNKTTLCQLRDALWEKQDNQLVFTIRSDRFLRNMVRSIVGCMVNIGLEKMTLLEFTTIIENKNADYAGFAVPACGLYLNKVDY
jgi:tRNA pseudouridine38-40 synthase